MTSPVTAVSIQPIATQPTVGQPATSTPLLQVVNPLDPMQNQQDILALSNKAKPGRNWLAFGINLGVNIVKRVCNGLRNVVNMFMPGQLGRTLRDTAMWTAGLSVFSFFLTGPLHIPAIPLYAVASLGFDAAGKFIAGVWQNPNKPNLHHAQLNQLGFMTPEQQRALGLNG